mmetsp:Transcript_129366/g.414672  ORF Transcript_129366/g.414672 Transcript_129366/m.414672 type:complete len:211 (-) Transcript_129366:521-1153(-)
MHVHAARHICCCNGSAREFHALQPENRARMARSFRELSGVVHCVMLVLAKSLRGGLSVQAAPTLTTHGLNSNQCVRQHRSSGTEASAAASWASLLRGHRGLTRRQVASRTAEPDLEERSRTMERAARGALPCHLKSITRHPSTSGRRCVLAAPLRRPSASPPPRHPAMPTETLRPATSAPPRRPAMLRRGRCPKPRVPSEQRWRRALWCE